MSYILDALKKSEQEREIGKIPTLKTVPQTVPKGKSTVVVWLAGAAVFFVSLALVYFYFELQHRVTVQQSVVRSTQPALNGEQSTLTSAVTEPPAPMDVVKQIDIDDVEKADVAQRIRSSDKSVLPAVAEPVVNNRVQTESTTLGEETIASIPAVEIKQVVTPTVIPPLEALLLEIRQRIPELSLDVHVYALEPKDRFVLINMRRYAEGQMTREGLLLQEVVSDGVILSYEGTLFRLNN